MKNGMDLLSKMRLRKIIIIISIVVVSLLAVGGVIAGIVISNANRTTLTYGTDGHCAIVSLDGDKLPTSLKKGKSVEFKVEANQGYVVDVVLANNVKVYRNASGVYKVTADGKKDSIGILAKTKVAELVSIGYTGELTYKEQYDGEVFNPEGLSFTRTYADGQTKELPISFLQLPTLVYGEEVSLTYGEESVTIEGLSIKYSITFDMGNFAKFTETNTEKLKKGYDGVKENLTNSIFPKSSEYSITYGSKIGALKSWTLVSPEGDKNLIYQPVWNHLDNFSANITYVENIPVLTVTADILVCESLELLKAKVGLASAKCTVVGNTLTTKLNLSLVEETTIAAIQGSQVLIYINEDISVPVPSYVNIESFDYGIYAYEISKSADSKLLIKKVMRTDYRVDYSKLEFVNDELNITMEVFDYITNTKQPLHEGTTAKILIGTYVLDAVLGGNLSTVSTTFDLQDFNINNLFVEGKNYQVKVEFTYNGISKQIDVPFGETISGSIIELGGYYYELISETNGEKVYLTYSAVPNPEFTVDSAKIEKVDESYILTVSGTVSHVTSIKIFVQDSNTNITISGEEVSLPKTTFACTFNLDNLQTLNSPIYNVFVIADNNDTYSQEVKSQVYVSGTTFEKENSSYEKFIYTVITENGNLQIKSEKEVVEPKANILGMKIVQLEEGGDFTLEIQGTYQNVTSLYIISNNEKGEEAVLENGEFTATYNLSNLVADGLNKFFSLSLNGNDDTAELLPYIEGNLDSIYSFMIEEYTQVKYEVFSQADLLAITKTTTEVNDMDISVSSMLINDFVLKVSGVCQNVDSVYLIITNGEETYTSEEGLDVYLDPVNFECEFNLKDIDFAGTQTYYVYLSVNAIKTKLENNFFIDELHQYEEDGYLIKYTLKGEDLLEIECEKEQILLPEATITSAKFEQDSQYNINLVLTGTSYNITELKLKVYESYNLIDEELISVSNNAFTISYTVSSLIQNSNYFFKLEADGVEQNIEVIPASYNFDYNHENYLVYNTSLDETLKLVIELQAKPYPEYTITSMKIELDEDEKPILTVSGTVENIYSMVLRGNSVYGEKVYIQENSNTFTLELDLTLLPIGELVYIELEYVGTTFETEGISELLENKSSNPMLQAKKYEYQGDELYVYEVDLTENEDKLLIITSIWVDESTYEITQIEIDNTSQVLLISGTCTDVRDVYLKVATKNGKTGVINEDLGTFIVEFDLRLLDADGSENFVMIIVNGTGYNVKNTEITSGTSYEATIEGSIYTTTVINDETNNLKLKREVDTSNLPDFEITDTSISGRDFFVSGEHNNLESIELICYDEDNNEFTYTHINNEFNEATFKLGYDLTTLISGKTYTFKLKIGDEYYSVANKGLTVNGTNKIVLDGYEYTFTTTEDDYGYLNINVYCQIETQKSILISNIQFTLEDDKPIMVVNGYTEGYEVIKIKSNSVLGESATIQNKAFVAKFDLSNLTEQNVYYNFYIVYDGEEEIIQNTLSNPIVENNTNFVFSKTELLNDIYTVKISEDEADTTEGNLVIIYTQSQVQTTVHTITTITLSDGILRVTGQVANVTNIHLKVDTVEGTSNIDGNNFDISIDLTKVTSLNNHIVYLVKDGVEEPIANPLDSLYIENGENTVYETIGYTYTYTVIADNTSNGNLVIGVTAVKTVEPEVNVNSIDITQSSEGLILNINGVLSSVDSLKLKVGEVYFDATIEDSLFTISANLKNLQLMESTILKLIYEDNEDTILNQDRLSTTTSYNLQQGEIVKMYFFTVNTDDELSLKISQRDLIVPVLTVEECKIEIISTVPTLIVTGTHQNVNRADFKIYYQNQNVYQEQIYCELLESTFSVSYNLSSLPQDTYYFELVYSNEDTQARQYITTSMTESVKTEVDDGVEKSVYELSKNSNGYLILNYYKKLTPTINFNSIYFNTIDNKPYMCFDVSVNNATSVVISVEDINSTVIDNIYCIDLSSLEMNETYLFTYKLDDEDAKYVPNQNLIMEGMNTIYTYSDELLYIYEVVSNADSYLSIKTYEEEIITPKISITSQSIEKEDEEYVLIVKGTYENVYEIQISAIGHLTVYDYENVAVFDQNGNFEIKFNFKNLDTTMNALYTFQISYDGLTENLKNVSLTDYTTVYEKVVDDQKLTYQVMESSILTINFTINEILEPVVDVYTISLERINYDENYVITLTLTGHIQNATNLKLKFNDVESELAQIDSDSFTVSIDLSTITTEEGEYLVCFVVDGEEIQITNFDMYKNNVEVLEGDTVIVYQIMDSEEFTIKIFYETEEPLEPVE